MKPVIPENYATSLKIAASAKDTARINAIIDEMAEQGLVHPRSKESNPAVTKPLVLGRGFFIPSVKDIR